MIVSVVLEEFGIDCGCSHIGHRGCIGAGHDGGGEEEGCPGEVHFVEYIGFWKLVGIRLDLEFLRESLSLEV